MLPIEVVKVSFMVFLLVGAPRIASAVQYTVGDGSGWVYSGVNYTSWAIGKRFQVGDTLVFNYTNGTHDVTEVGEAGYSQCITSPNSGVLTSGTDAVTLGSTGPKWFICGFPGHCDAGQKLAITVV
ncbi:basic blue protein-like [Typha angustifolia]|uniref:basic blue protein-like n=1 Tax=Typha angustifolia TaxID=59011 RepID=UPI003C2C021B